MDQKKQETKVSAQQVQAAEAFGRIAFGVFIVAFIALFAVIVQAVK
jgi:hypothetical protein